MLRRRRTLAGSIKRVRGHSARLRRSLFRLLLAVPLLLLSGCVGWASSSLPPSLEADEREILEQPRETLTVGVERFRWPAYSDSLLDGLRRTGIFERVAFADEFERGAGPDLTARVERTIHGSATIPFWTLVTFGIVPSSVDEDWGWSFSLAPRDRPSERRTVEFVHTGRTTLGWITLLEVFLPDRNVGPWTPKSTKRMSDRLALAIVRDGLVGGKAYRPRVKRPHR